MAHLCFWRHAALQPPSRWRLCVDDNLGVLVAVANWILQDGGRNAAVVLHPMQLHDNFT